MFTGITTIIGVGLSDTWTNHAGNTLFAECCGMTNGLVSFKKVGGGIQTYPLTTFLPSEQIRMAYALDRPSVPACIRPEWTFYTAQLSSATQASQCRVALEVFLRTVAARHQDMGPFPAMQADYWTAQAKKIEHQRRQVIVEGHWADRIKKSEWKQDTKGTLQ